LSTRVRARLLKLHIQTTREEREEIDREIEHRIGESCETEVDKITDQELRDIVEYVRRRKKMPAPQEIMAIA
jgi:TPP-dependent pyruvate/acetoin dehydrogenase alpha subunit